MQRRTFVSGSLAAGFGSLLLPEKTAANAEDATPLNLGIIGVGLQGRVLINGLLALGGVRIRAVCDMWPYRSTGAVDYLKVFDQEAAGFAEYQEMLEKTPDLQAVVVATPDFVHSEQTVACLNAGLHVYCEAPMAPTLDAAQAMADAASKTGKLLQVGYQRRSSPRYQHVEKNLIQDAHLIQDITAASTQWNQSDLWELGWPRRQAMAEADLQRYGYANMHEFRNWRWFRRHSAGPFAAAAVHQIDVLNRMLGASPRTVLAGGTTGFFPDRECHDHVTAIFEYPLDDRTLQATCQVLTTTSGTAGNHELLVGTAGSIRISENPRWAAVFREPSAEPWDEWVRNEYLVKPAAKVEPPPETGESLDRVGQAVAVETGQVQQYQLPALTHQSPFQYHLANFLEAVRGHGSLNCPPEIAIPAETAVLRAIEAMQAKKLVSIFE